MAWVPISKQVERKIGSILVVLLLLLIPLLSWLMRMAFVLLLALLRIPFFQSYWMDCTVGLSGVIFAFIVVQAELVIGSQSSISSTPSLAPHAPPSSRSNVHTISSVSASTPFVGNASTAPRPDHVSVFGLFWCHKKYLPWLVLLITTIIFPGASFLGHLSGILVGYLFTKGALNWLLPHDDAIRRFQNASLCGLPPLCYLPGFEDGEMDDNYASGGHTLGSASSSSLPFYSNYANTRPEANSETPSESWTTRLLPFLRRQPPAEPTDTSSSLASGDPVQGQPHSVMRQNLAKAAESRQQPTNGASSADRNYGTMR